MDFTDAPWGDRVSQKRSLGVMSFLVDLERSLLDSAKGLGYVTWGAFCWLPGRGRHLLYEADPVDQLFTFGVGLVLWRVGQHLLHDSSQAAGPDQRLSAFWGVSWVGTSGSSPLIYRF